jgi:hypothetical protein
MPQYALRIGPFPARNPATIKLTHYPFLGCEIEFASSVDQVVFPDAVKLLPISSADPHLNELLIKYCEEALDRGGPERTTLRSIVENAMAPLLRRPW